VRLKSVAAAAHPRARGPERERPGKEVGEGEVVERGRRGGPSAGGSRSNRRRAGAGIHLARGE
jgi:hypothetical protein